MPLSVTIRPITPADAPAFHAVLDTVARERRYLRLTTAPPVESSAGFIAANIESGNPQFVALDVDRLVGWCDICRSGEAGSEHIGWLGMGLLPSHRGQGIGHQLLTATLDAARGKFERIELEVYASNTAAIALYDKAGFAHEGRRHKALLRDGKHDDILMMGLLL